MTPFKIWSTMIKARVYPKEEITKRVNVVYAVGQLNDVEYAQLINLIETVYEEVA